MKVVVFALPGNEGMQRSLASLIPSTLGDLEMRSFPDGETYMRYKTPIDGCTVVLVATLDHPDGKILPLLYAAETARELGAAKVLLVAPYLAYLRQDTRFTEGEAVTSRMFARLVSRYVDGVVTVDPHLHRLKHLSDVYSVPAAVALASGIIASWVRTHVSAPLLVGPDEESLQWVAEIANLVKCPCSVLHKTRRGDREVQLALPDLKRWSGRTPVLVDDIISSGTTMAADLTGLRAAGFGEITCIAVHGIFCEGALEALTAAGANNILATNTVHHSVYALDVAPSIAKTLHDILT